MVLPQTQRTRLADEPSARAVPSPRCKPWTRPRGGTERVYVPGRVRHGYDFGVGQEDAEE